LCEPNYVPACSNIDSLIEVVGGERQTQYMSYLLFCGRVLFHFIDDCFNVCHYIFKQRTRASIISPYQ